MANIPNLTKLHSSKVPGGKKKKHWGPRQHTVTGTLLASPLPEQRNHTAWSRTSSAGTRCSMPPHYHHHETPGLWQAASSFVRCSSSADRVQKFGRAERRNVAPHGSVRLVFRPPECVLAAGTPCGSRNKPPENLRGFRANSTCEQVAGCSPAVWVGRVLQEVTNAGGGAMAVRSRLRPPLPGIPPPTATWPCVGEAGTTSQGLGGAHHRGLRAEAVRAGVRMAEVRAGQRCAAVGGDRHREPQRDEVGARAAGVHVRGGPWRENKRPVPAQVKAKFMGKCTKKWPHTGKNGSTSGKE